MNEILINFSVESPKLKNTEILIKAEKSVNEDLLYRFIIGTKGKWATVKDFSEENEILWVPEEESHYTIMVQARKVDSPKAFDYLVKSEYDIGEINRNKITNISISKDVIIKGDEVVFKVETYHKPVMLRYFIENENSNWILLKDYSFEDVFSFTFQEEGKKWIRVECKEINSESIFDEYKEIEIQVTPIEKVTIVEYISLSSELVTDSELKFKVMTNNTGSRDILYKFVKINIDGRREVIKDFSKENFVTYIETSPDEYKLLCFVKDIQSTDAYDDRAMITFRVFPYKKIELEKFITEVSSPQYIGSAIEFYARVTGGQNLLYRFLLEDESGEDTGYTSSNSFIWEPKVAGEFKILLYVKDSSFAGEYEAKSEINYIIEDGSNFRLIINEIVIDKKDPILVKDAVSIMAKTEGSQDLRYSFIVSLDGNIVEKVEYGICNWVNFTPENKGDYEINIWVKDKYSKREYDVKEAVTIEAVDFLPGEIDYVLIPANSKFSVGDNINFEAIIRNTKSTLVRYVLKKDEQKIEETKFSSICKYMFMARESGQYSVDVYAKNINSINEYDSKKEFDIFVVESQPIVNTLISCDKTSIKSNEGATFRVHHGGGKVVLYEFYLMEKEAWVVAQKYSRKDNFTYLPLEKGKCKILVLCKSKSSKMEYEDYAILNFFVE